MMDKITGTTGWGMEPTVSSDGLLSMLFESGEGFSTAFDSAMLATEPMVTEESLISPESELQDGLQLMESEWNAVVMPGLTPTELTQTSTSLPSSTTSALPTAIVDTTVDVGDDIGTLDGPDIMTSGDLTGDMFTQQDLEPSEWIQNTMTETSEFTQAAEQVQSSVVAASTTSKAVTSSKTPAGVRSEKMDSMDNTSDMRLDDDSVTSARAVTHAAESGEGEEEIMHEWDSSHLQLDGEFEPLAANSPFPNR